MINSYQYSGSFDDILKLMIQHAREDEIDDHIIGILKQFYDKELDKEHRPFSRTERTRLFKQVTKAILTDVLGKTGGTKE